ncbi:unnamed protein product [Pylaiella littoralis]
MAESCRNYAQRLGEERAMGRVRWKQLARRREEEELVSGARSEDIEDDLELQRIFMKYCRFGDRRNTGRMVVAKLTALCKDAGLIDKKFPMQRVEISFSRLKPKDLSHLPYSSFLACLDDITIQHPTVRRIADATAAATIKEAIATLVTPNVVHPGSGSGSGSGNRSGTGKGSRKRAGGYSGNQPTPGAGSSRGAGSPKSLDRISSEAQDGKKSTTEHATRGGQFQNGTVTTANYSTDGRLSEAKEKMVEKMVGAAKTTVVAAAEELETSFASGFRPDDQRLLVLLQQYVLVNSQAGREACSELDEEGKGARQRALGRLEAATVTIQAALGRGCMGREQARKAWERREMVRHNVRLNWAASLLQTRFRVFSAQTRVSKMAVKRFYRCLDDLTGAEYYFDPKTGKAWWTKPKVLGRFEIPTAVVVPTGEEIMVPMCHECAEDVAAEICADCDEDMLCELCARRLHSTGNATTHLRVSIDKCDECSFQVAVKQCKQCGDNFCVSCFAYLHRKGRLRRHTFEPLVAMCHDCEDRAQALRCFGCHAEGLLLLCKPCLEARHHGLHEFELADHRIETVGLRSMKVKRMREDMAARAKERWMRAASVAAGTERRKKKMLDAAIKIQSAWRGYLARKRRRYLMGQHLLWKIQRLKDDQARK